MLIPKRGDVTCAPSSPCMLNVRKTHPFYLSRRLSARVELSARTRPIPAFRDKALPAVPTLINPK